jgi:integrase
MVVRPPALHTATARDSTSVVLTHFRACLKVIQARAPALRSKLKKACKAAGIAPFTPHGLRHLVVDAMAYSGVDESRSVPCGLLISL